MQNKMKIGGKVYTESAFHYKQKSEAIAKAKSRRKEGFLARVIKGKGTFGQTGYVVYVRGK